MISAHIQDRSKLLLANGPPCKPNCRSTRLSPKNDEDRAATFSTGLWWNMAPSPGSPGLRIGWDCSFFSSMSRGSCAHNLQNEKMDTGVLNQAEKAAAWTGIHDDRDVLVTFKCQYARGLGFCEANAKSPAKKPRTMLDRDFWIVHFLVGLRRAMGNARSRRASARALYAKARLWQPGGTGRASGRGWGAWLAYLIAEFCRHA
jgi:hypothetical protein